MEQTWRHNWNGCCMMRKKQNKGSLISINSLVVSMSREEQEERGVYSEYCQYNRRAERLFIIKQKLLFSSFFSHILKKRKTSSNKTQKFWFTATKCEAPLLSIQIPANLLDLFFPPSTPLTKIPLLTGWIVQWADLVLSLEKLQKLFPPHLLFKYTLIFSEWILFSEEQYLSHSTINSKFKTSSLLRKRLLLLGNITLLRLIRWWGHTACSKDGHCQPLRCQKLSLVTSSHH